MFHSIPYEPRKLEATEGRLEAIYAAAKIGLKGDALALAAGMLPTEYRQLTQFDPVAEMAELKGRADGDVGRDVGHGPAGRCPVLSPSP